MFTSFLGVVGVLFLILGLALYFLVVTRKTGPGTNSSFVDAFIGVFAIVLGFAGCFLTAFGFSGGGFLGFFRGLSVLWLAWSAFEFVSSTTAERARYIRRSVLPVLVASVLFLVF